jgi:hypothetical protein
LIDFDGSLGYCELAFGQADVKVFAGPALNPPARHADRVRHADQFLMRVCNQVAHLHATIG